MIASLWGYLQSSSVIALLMLLAAALAVVKLKLPSWSRLVVLGTGLLLLGFYYQGCMCPVGVLANLPVRITGILQGEYTEWLVLFLLPVLFAVFAGRVYCGGVCPFGAVQEFIYLLGGKLGLKRKASCQDGLAWFKYTRYAFLLAVLVLTPVLGLAWWCQIDPFGYLFSGGGTLTALVLLAVLAVASLTTFRPWCRLICPYGALLGIVAKDTGLLAGDGKNGLYGPGIQESACQKCGLCQKKCPVQAIEDYRIEATECINCGACSHNCKLDAVA